MDRFEYRRVNRDLSKCLRDHRQGRQRFRGRRPLCRPKRSNRPMPRSNDWVGRRQGRPPQTGHGQHAVAGDHQGVRAKLELHFGRQLPGNHQGAHRSRPGGQGRQSRRAQGERDSGTPDPGRDRIPHVPGIRSTLSAGGAPRNGRPRRQEPRHQLPAAAIRRRDRRQRRTRVPCERPFAARRSTKTNCRNWTEEPCRSKNSTAKPTRTMMRRRSTIWMRTTTNRFNAEGRRVAGTRGVARGFRRRTARSLARSLDNFPAIDT